MGVSAGKPPGRYTNTGFRNYRLKWVRRPDEADLIGPPAYMFLQQNKM
jgi:hypothetical protein